MGLKLNIQKSKIMASGPITSWQREGENVGAVTDFIFLDSKITADGDYSHEIKRRLLLGRKAMTNLDSMLKSRDITLPTKVGLVKAMVFPVVMYGCESWTITMRSPLRSPAQVEGTQGFLPQPEKDLERPSSTRLEARFPYNGSGAMTCCPSPLAWRPDFPGAPREAH